jgi:hypothetical protein
MEYPKNIDFIMTASSGKWRGTFMIDQGRATIKATLIDKDNGIYKVIMKAPKPYVGPYEYRMQYDILKQWEDNAQSGDWYNNHIRGNRAYFPK